MKKLEQLYEGKAKKVFATDDPDLVIVDYKTDRVSAPSVLLERYRPQLAYYKRALEQITGRKVKETYVYSFTFGEAFLL